jgi:cyclic dehypoxanthinyl futalosine synthase
MTEEVVSATGLDHGVDEQQVIHLIREAGWTPAQRTTQYDLLRIH